MHLQVVAIVATFLSSALAAPTQHVSHVLHERRDLEHPAAKIWKKRSSVPIGRELPVRIGLQQTNLDAAHDLLVDMCDITAYA